MTRMRRNAKSLGEAPGDHDGILDVLANLVGVLTLVGVLSALVAANAALRIRTPLTRDTAQDFVLLMAGRNGIWNLQPAKEAMINANLERIEELRGCLSYGIFGFASCIDAVSSRVRSAQVGQARYLVSDGEISLQRLTVPDVDLTMEGGDQDLDKLVQQIAVNDRAIFVLLEREGFSSYRALRAAAGNVNVDLGWEPWSTEGKVYFGGGGRGMTVQ